MPKDVETPQIPTPGYRVPRRSGTDPATRRLMALAAGIGGTLVVIVGLWSMLGGKTSGVPVVSAPAGAMRVKPTNPGGMQIADANAPILSGSQPGTNVSLAPPPETPDLAALQSPPTTPSRPSTSATTTAASSASVAPGPSLPTPPALPGGAAAPVMRLAANSLPLPPPSPPPLHLASVALVRPPAATPGSGKPTEVQLAAMNSREAADHEWQDLRTALPTLFDARTPLITRVEVDGHTFWRLRTGGFTNVADATRFCASLRAKGKGCTIASF